MIRLKLGLGFGFKGGNPSSLPTPPASPILDTLSAAAAYSLRLLRTAYAGSCIRVRRSSDNTEQNIGFVNGVLNTVALLAFVGAGDGFVVTWYDQLGNVRNATQATAANQPRIVNAGVLDVQNTKPTSFFNGTNSWFENFATHSLTTFNAVAASNVVKPFAGLYTATASELILGGSGSSVIDVVTVHVNGSTASRAITLSQAFVWTLTLAAANNQARSFGQEFNVPGAGRAWDGTCSELIVFAGALSTADRQLLEANQKAYYATP